MMSRSSRLALCLALVSCAGSEKKPEAQQSGTPGTPAATKLADAPDQYFTTGDVRLRYRDFGSGTPIVFIHGYSRSLEDWLATADSLAPGHRIIAYDVRGFGKSSKFGDTQHYGAAMAQDVVALLDHLKIDRAHLVGHSMGALIAGNVAARYPERVASASLIAGPFYDDSVRFATSTARWVGDLEHGVGLRKFLVWLFPGMPDSIARASSAQAMAANDSVSMVATMRTFGGLAITADRATHASVPVLIAAGGSDPLAPLSRALSKRWPKAQLLEVPRADHVQIVSRPEVLAGMRTMIR